MNNNLVSKRLTKLPLSDQVDGNEKLRSELYSPHVQPQYDSVTLIRGAQKDADELKLKVIELEHKVNMLKEVMSDRAEEKQKAT
ncbi:hypothetical protein Tco_1267133, partial [Tanacetum coccineum]